MKPVNRLVRGLVDRDCRRAARELLLLPALSGCWRMQEVAQGAGPADAGSDGDSDSWPSMEQVDGGLHDPVSDLVWQDPPLFDLLNSLDAIAYCQELAWAGYDDWRLPDVDELQSLLRGCPGAQACGVEDPECLLSSCNDGDDCAGC
jgi:hypothetical protein